MITGKRHPFLAKFQIGFDETGLLLAANAELVRLAAHPVGLRLLDARGVALHPDAELLAKVEELFVGEPQLLCQLVYSWVLGQRGS